MDEPQVADVSPIPRYHVDKFLSKQALDLIDTYFYLDKNKSSMSHYAKVSQQKVDLRFQEIMGKILSDPSVKHQTTIFLNSEKSSYSAE